MQVDGGVTLLKSKKYNFLNYQFSHGYLWDASMTQGCIYGKHTSKHNLEIMIKELDIKGHERYFRLDLKVRMVNHLN